MFLVHVELQKDVAHVSTIRCMLVPNPFRLHALFHPALSKLHPLIAATRRQKRRGMCYMTPVLQGLTHKLVLLPNIPARDKAEIVDPAMKADKDSAGTCQCLRKQLVVYLSIGILIARYKRQVIFSVKSESQKYAGMQKSKSMVALVVLWYRAEYLEPRDTVEDGDLRVFRAEME
jgi:hypothetical protein